MLRFLAPRVVRLNTPTERGVPLLSRGRETDLAVLVVGMGLAILGATMAKSMIVAVIIMIYVDVE